MIVQFVYPSTGQITGGEVVLIEFANGLARRGCQVRFLHGPSAADRIDSLDQLPEISREPGVEHVIFDSYDDPHLEVGDVIFQSAAPDWMGLPVTVIQGHRMLSEEWERLSFRRPGLKICVARWLIDVGERYGVPRSRMFHVPPGIDHGVFALRTPLGDRPIDVTVLHHPHREKGWKNGSTMLEMLVRRRPELRVVVFGRRRPPTLPDGVEFVLAPDHRQLAEDIYGQTRVFVQSSRNEGFGLTPVEAMACGAALVTTDCGGSRDYGLPGETADVVPVEDPSSLADAVEALLDDEPRRLRYAAAGERHVRRFDWDRSAEVLHGHLTDYLADPEPFLSALPDSALPDD